MRPILSAVAAAGAARWPELVAACIALGTRLWFLGHFAETAFFAVGEGAHDRAVYDAAARAVAGGAPWPAGAFEHLPLYPWMLGALYALFGPALRVAALAGIACDTLTALLLVRLARRLGARAGLACAAGLLYALYPLAIAYAALTMPNTLNALLVTALALGLHAAPRDRVAPWLGLGALAGGAALGFAGTVLIVVALLAHWGFARRRPGAPRPACLAAFAAVFALTLLPVAAHNSRAEGRFVLLTTHGGFNLYLGNHERATGYPLRVRDFRMTARDLLEDAHQAAEEASGRTLTRAESSAWWTAQARAFWKAHPGAGLQLTGRKLLLVWNRTDVDDLRVVEQLRLFNGFFATPLWPGFAWFGVLGLIGLALAPRAPEVRTVLLAGLAGLVLFFITARYRLAFAPLLAAIGAAGATVVWTDLRAARARARDLAVCALACVIVFLPTRLRDLRPVDRYNASVQLLAAGRPDDALREARAGIEIDANNADLWHAEGSALFRMGGYDDAAAAFRRSAELNPAHPHAAYNLALSLARLGDYCGARDALRDAAALRPLSPQARHLLAELAAACAEP